FVSATTVKTHVGKVLTKLGAHDRVQSAVLAYRTGIVQVTEIVKCTVAGDNGRMEPRRGWHDKDLANRRRAKPATICMTMMVIIGALVLGSSLAIHFFTGTFSVPTFVVGVVLVGIAVAYLVVNAFKDDAAGN